MAAAAPVDAATRERVGLLPALSPADLARLSVDEQLAHWRERQRHVLWCLTRTDQQLARWERDGYTDADQARVQEQRTRQSLMQLFAHNSESRATKQPKAVKEVFADESCDALFARVRVHIRDSAQLPDGGQYLFCGFVGSRQYNLQTLHSDYDLLIIWHPPPHLLPSEATPMYGMGAAASATALSAAAVAVAANGVASKATAAGRNGSYPLSPTRYDTCKQPDGFKPDYTTHATTRFATMLLDGDPRAVELLHTTHPSSLGLVTAAWTRLCAQRHGFVTQQLLRKYLSHIRRETDAINSGLFPCTHAHAKYAKKTYVLARLCGFVTHIMRAAERMVTASSAASAAAGSDAQAAAATADGKSGDLMTVWLADGSAEHARLMAVRKGQFTHAPFLAECGAVVAACEKWLQQPSCPLPATADPMRPFLWEWLHSLSAPAPTSTPTPAPAAAK